MQVYSIKAATDGSEYDNRARTWRLTVNEAPTGLRSHLGGFFSIACSVTSAVRCGSGWLNESRGKASAT